MLDDARVQRFMAGHWGYGNPCAALWFVGLEEGGGGTLDEVRKRLDVWADRGEQGFEDLHEYHAGIGETQWTGPHAKRQVTWNQLARTCLVAIDRESYEASVGNDRIEALRALIKEHKPRAVVFYGLSKRKEWQKVTQSAFSQCPRHAFLRAESGRTSYFLIRHPSRAKNSIFEGLGLEIRSLIHQ